MTIIELFSKVTDVTLKQDADATARQSKKPSRIVRSPTEVDGADPIPANGEFRVNEPLRIAMCETEEATGPEPIAAQSDAVALIFSPEMLRLVTLDMPGDSADPDPIPAPPDPVAVTFPP
jgi:hypothetical protein